METKKLWLQTKYEQLKIDEAIAKKAQAKHEGYITGINLQDDDEQPPPAWQTNNIRNKRTPVICKHSSKKGHTTTRSKKCFKHRDNTSSRQQPVVPQDEDDFQPLEIITQQQLSNDAVETAAKDVDNIDTMPLDDGAADDKDSAFYESQSSFESDSESSLIVV